MTLSAPSLEDAKAIDALEDALIALLWEAHHNPVEKLDVLEAQFAPRIAACENLAQAFSSIRRKLVRQIG